MISDIQRHMTISLYKVSDEDDVTDALTDVLGPISASPPFLVIARTNMTNVILEKVKHYNT